MAQPRLSFKEMCAKFDVTPRTLRYYEYIELLSPDREGRARWYRPRDVARMTLILRGRRWGFSLEEIRQWLQIYDKQGTEAQGRAWVEAADRQLLTLPELIDLLHDAGRPVGLAIETKHPSPYGHRLEDEVLALLLREGWDPGTGLLGRLRISLMSFHPDAVRRLLESVPARSVCQLAGTTTRRTVGESLRVGPAAAAVLHAGMRLVVPTALPVIGAGLVEIAGPGIGLVRGRPDLVRRWAARGCVLRVWTVDDRRDVELCLALGVQ